VDAHVLAHLSPATFLLDKSLPLKSHAEAHLVLVDLSSFHFIRLFEPYLNYLDYFS